MSDKKMQRFATMSEQLEQAAVEMTNDMIALGLTPGHCRRYCHRPDGRRVEGRSLGGADGGPQATAATFHCAGEGDNRPLGPRGCDPRG